MADMPNQGQTSDEDEQGGMGQGQDKQGEQDQGMGGETGGEGGNQY